MRVTCRDHPVLIVDDAQVTVDLDTRALSRSVAPAQGGRRAVGPGTGTPRRARPGWESEASRLTSSSTDLCLAVDDDLDAGLTERGGVPLATASIGRGRAFDVTRSVIGT